MLIASVNLTIINPCVDMLFTLHPKGLDSLLIELVFVVDIFAFYQGILPLKLEFCCCTNYSDCVCDFSY